MLTAAQAETLAEIEAIGTRIESFSLAEDGNALVYKSRLCEYSGDSPGPQGIHLVMLLDGGGPFRFTYDGIDFNQRMAPGNIAMRLGGSRAHGHWPEATTMQVGVDQAMLLELMVDANGGMPVDVEALASKVLTSGPLRLELIRCAAVVGDAAAPTLQREERMLSVAKALVQQCAAPVPRKVRERPLSALHAERVREYVNDVGVLPPTIEQLAGLCQLSRAHFTRAFNLSFGVTPSQYVNQVRMLRAATLLREGRRTVLDIALESGYSNPSKFAAAFRRGFGMAPTQWQRL
ncbi:MAG: AraC family transcriptional regulator [Pseudomonadota bacterium]